MDWTLKVGDLAIVCATLLGPVLAVQAQKWIERARESKQRKVAVFRTLMATRGAMLSPEHVAALNAVPIEFYGKSDPLRDIGVAWKTLLDHLNNFTGTDLWGQTRLDLFNVLLLKISTYLGYPFSALEIKREVYLPAGHITLQTDQDIIRKGLVQLFDGKTPLPMDVKGFPSDPQFVAKQAELQELLLSWLKGDRSVKVKADTP
jgi:hypothetical protein